MQAVQACRRCGRNARMRARGAGGRRSGRAGGRRGGLKRQIRSACRQSESARPSRACAARRGGGGRADSRPLPAKRDIQKGCTAQTARLAAPRPPPRRSVGRSGASCPQSPPRASKPPRAPAALGARRGGAAMAAQAATAVPAAHAKTVDKIAQIVGGGVSRDVVYSQYASCGFDSQATVVKLVEGAHAAQGRERALASARPVRCDQRATERSGRGGRSTAPRGPAHAGAAPWRKRKRRGAVTVTRPFCVRALAGARAWRPRSHPTAACARLPEASKNLSRRAERRAGAPPRRRAPSPRQARGGAPQGAPQSTPPRAIPAAGAQSAAAGRPERHLGYPFEEFGGGGKRPVLALRRPARRR